MRLVPGSCYGGGVVRRGGADESRSLMEGGKAMRRRISVLVAMAVMLTMMLAVVAPAMAARQGVCPSGLRAAPNVVTPGSEPSVFFDCVSPGQPGQPPVIIR